MTQEQFDNLTREVAELRTLIICAIPDSRLPPGVERPRFTDDGALRSALADRHAAQDAETSRVFGLLAGLDRNERTARNWPVCLTTMTLEEKRRYLAVGGGGNLANYVAPRVVPLSILRNQLSLRKAFRGEAAAATEAQAAIDRAVLAGDLVRDTLGGILGETRAGRSHGVLALVRPDELARLSGASVEVPEVPEVPKVEAAQDEAAEPWEDDEITTLEIEAKPVEEAPAGWAVDAGIPATPNKPAAKPKIVLRKGPAT